MRAPATTHFVKRSYNAAIGNKFVLLDGLIVSANLAMVTHSIEPVGKCMIFV